MPDPRKPLIPNFKKDLIALWKGFGPGWMLAALIVVTVPVCLLTGGFFLKGLAEILRLLLR